MQPVDKTLETFRQAFSGLGDLLKRRTNGAERWLEREISRLYRGDKDEPESE